MADKTGASPERIAFAFAAVRTSFRMPELNAAIDGLDGKIGGALQLSLYASVQALLLDRMVWFLRHADLSQGLGAVTAHYAKGIAEVDAALDGSLTPELGAAAAARGAELVSAGVPVELASRLSRLPMLAAAPDIVLIADRCGRAIRDVAATYFAAGALFGLDRVRTPARAIRVNDYFDQLALDRALDAIAEAERRMTAEMLATGAAGAPAVEAWTQQRGYEVQRIRGAIDEIVRSAPSIAKVSVAAGLVGDLIST